MTKERFDYYIDEFSNHLLIERALSLNTVEAYNGDIIQYCNYLEVELNITDIHKIESNDIMNFLSHLYDLKLKPKSIARKISAIKMFHKFLFLNNYIKENVSSFIEQPKLERTLPDVLSVHDIDLLLDSFKEEDEFQIRNKTMVELMYSTGLRVSELVNLDIEDLHLTMGFLKCRGKGNKERIVPIGEKAIHMLELYLNDAREKMNVHYDHQILFLNRNGQRISRQYFWKVLKEHAKMIGLKKEISPHKLRHSFATHLLEHQVDIRFIQELLGHKLITTTQIYTHVNSKKLNEIVRNYHPRK